MLGLLEEEKMLNFPNENISLPMSGKPILSLSLNTLDKIAMANMLECRQTYWEQFGAKSGTLTAIHSGSDATIKTHYVDKLLRF